MVEQVASLIRILFKNDARSARSAWDALKRRTERSHGVVRKGGLEPSRYCYRQPLKLDDLPLTPTDAYPPDGSWTEVDSTAR